MALKIDCILLPKISKDRDHEQHTARDPGVIQWKHGYHLDPSHRHSHVRLVSLGK